MVKVNELEAGAAAVTASGGASGMKSAGAYAGFKAAGILGAAVTISSAFVMMMMNPATKREMFLALLSTFTFALFGGSFAIEYFGLHKWLMDGSIGLFGIGGVFIVCGIPGWAIVRASFIWLNSNEKKSIIEIIKQILRLK